MLGNAEEHDSADTRGRGLGHGARGRCRAVCCTTPGIELEGAGLVALAHEERKDEIGGVEPGLGDLSTKGGGGAKTARAHDRKAGSHGFQPNRVNWAEAGGCPDLRWTRERTMIFTTAKQAADDPRILVFGRLLGAANRLEYLLGHALEESTGITHSIFELLLLVGRAGGDGVPVRDIAQSRVVTSGGATRLVHRAVELGLIERRPSATDGRVQLVELTTCGEQKSSSRPAQLHVRNIERYLVDVLPADQARSFAEAIRTLSKNARGRFRSCPDPIAITFDEMGIAD